MAKQYKPGQFVWIRGKKHRVTKTPYVPVCNICPYNIGPNCPTEWSCLILLPNNCYPKPIQL